MLPAGTKIECTAHFDNSPNNPANPDPKKEIHFGEQSWDEMMIGFFDVAVSRDTTRWTDAAEEGKGHGRRRRLSAGASAHEGLLSVLRSALLSLMRRRPQALPPLASRTLLQGRPARSCRRTARDATAPVRRRRWRS